MLPEPLAVTLLVIDALEQLDIPYLIGGSLASAMHGTARSTLDTDLLADFHPEKVGALVQKLQSAFYIDAEMILDAIQYQSSFNLIHWQTMFKVDIFITKHSRFEHMQFQRRELQVVTEDPLRKAYVATAEDIILAKLQWYRLGGEISDRQWGDVLGVLKVQSGRLDLEYLRSWAFELDVLDLFQKAFRETE